MEIGDSVLYTPGLEHGLDADASGFLFRFVYLEDGRNSAEKFKKGDTAPLMHHKEDNRPRLSNIGGILIDSKGHKVAPSAPLTPWPATITALHGDGTVDLMVKHPRGDHEFGACNVKQDD